MGEGAWSGSSGASSRSGRGRRTTAARGAGPRSSSCTSRPSPRSTSCRSWPRWPGAASARSRSTRRATARPTVEHPQPEAVDYAGWTAEAIEALGVERCAVYGSHTGASIALELAASRPDLVACAVLDGLPAFSAEERADLLANYLPTFPPQPGGEHLLTLWSRYRVQHLHFPWYAQRDETRLDLDMPDPWHLQEGVLDFLRAGDGYRVAYAAAFRHEPGPALAALRCRPRSSRARTT
ncbi:MAG: alpha/beta hydrolase [Thermoleophilia bacterium]